MTYGAKTRENQIAISLARCAASVKEAGSGHWEFALANGKTLEMSARLFEEWLVLDAPLADGMPRGGWWELLKLNATLEGLSKFVLIPDARSVLRRPTNFSLSLTPDPGTPRQTEVCRTAQSVHLRADIPPADDADSESDCESQRDGALTTRLIEACASLKAAFRSFRGEKTRERQESASPASAEDRLDELRRLCGDAGWPFIERSAGRVMVDLDVRSGFYQAAVEHQAEGTHIAVEVARFEALGETSRQALSFLLLGTGAAVRLARPMIEEKEDEVAARFEVRFTTAPSPVELGHAFAALSVACAMSGREARALQDEGLARDYLWRSRQWERHNKLGSGFK